MATKVNTETFRTSFKTLSSDLWRWFPGHMGKGLKSMQTKLKSVDCIIEVHDARIPLSGRNSDFKYTISGIKPHILVLNKLDLIESSHKRKIKKSLQNDYENIIFTNCKNQKCKGVQEIFPLAQDLINNSNRYNRATLEDYQIMIIGIPNVGKSSLVNALRIRHLGKGNATPVGAAPGITRSVMNKIKMSEDPLFYMVDTPGILSPKVTSTETGLKLALCATLHDHLIGERIIVDYLLYWLNKQQNFNYVDIFQMEKPTDNILEVLEHICTVFKKTIRIRDYANNYVIKPDFDLAAKMMLKMFRNGSLGKIMLDEDLIN